MVKSRGLGGSSTTTVTSADPDTNALPWSVPASVPCVQSHLRPLANVTVAKSGTSVPSAW